MSDTQQVIYTKLEAFIRKYHTSELIKGVLLFIGIGVFYFLVSIGIEYLFWLSPLGRTVLFLLFIVIEAGLFIFFILRPVLRLLKLRKGLDYTQASIIIGNHFSEVSDTLLNFLQLSNNQSTTIGSDLLQASIDQKAAHLQWVPFSNVVQHKRNISYVPIAVLAIVLVMYLLWIPTKPIFSDSFNRFVAYNQTFVPPAPFAFQIKNSKLHVQQGEDFVLQFSVVGSILPESCSIVIDDQLFYANKISATEYEYHFKQLNSDVLFEITANAVTSMPYQIQVTEVPVVANFLMKFIYPSYLNKPSEVVTGTGNATLPEGTKVQWYLQTLATDAVYWQNAASKIAFTKSDAIFKYEKQLLESVAYTVSTSNSKVKDFEKLQYAITIDKDDFPKITCKHLPDSLKQTNNAVYGQVSDDYGLSQLKVFFYPVNDDKALKSLVIPVKKDLFDQFYFVLQDAVELPKGVVYNFYFEVSDNDGINGAKTSRSTVFTFDSKSTEQLEKENLSSQSETISDIKNSLDDNKQQLKQLDKLERLSKEKNKLNYEEQLKVKDFAEKQKEEERMMKNFAKELQQNLEKFNQNKKDPFKEELVDRLKKTQEDLERNQKLLDELAKLNDKIKQEDLTQKLEKLKQESKNQSKSLEQLLELTKKFYVEKKAEQLAKNLEQLSQEEKQLSDKKSTPQEQQKINETFNKIKEELNQLDKQNKDLKTPLSLPNTDPLEQAIDQDLNKAKEELSKENASKAKQKQKEASDKMKEMSKSLSESIEAGEMEQLQEDAAMLRQIMDNMLTYSFSQEKLLNTFKGIKKGSPSYPKHLKTQQFLKTQFKHIDDSLFVLSMRNPVISDVIIKEIGSVYYNMDQAMESFAETQIEKGVSHQQYVMTSTNVLADLLSDALNNMQMQMNASGKGKPKPGGKSKGDKQLQDIMKSQEGISEKIQKGMKPGEKPGESGKPKPGGSGSEGMSGEIFEIYKQQQQLRESLEQMLQKNGLGGNGSGDAINKMKALEKQLLNKGFTQEAISQAQQLKIELLKLEKAQRKQGEEDKREAITNKTNHTGLLNNNMPDSISEYLKSIEILNREKLPLQPSINTKVQKYFNND